MDPNAKYYQYQGPSYAPQQPQRSGIGKKIVLVLIFLLLIGGAAAGGYIVQQQRVDDANREKAELQQQLAEATKTEEEQPVTPNQFNYPQVSFTFSYPSDWTVDSPQPVTFDNPLPDNYKILLLAPGTVRAATPIGGPAIYSKVGASITISKVNTSETDVRKAFDAFPGGTLPTFKDVTVAGTSGVEYEYMYEGPKYLTTAFVKGGAIYYITFEAEDDANLKSNDNYKTYQTLLSSLQFK